MAAKRTVLISGCSGGSLGSALALSFHNADGGCSRRGRNLTKLKKVDEAGIETVQLDTLLEESTARGVAQVQQLSGSLDTLLNDAGAGHSLPLTDIDIAKARELFDLNVCITLPPTSLYNVVKEIVEKATAGLDVVEQKEQGGPRKVWRM
ncbi:hypothetical protein BBP40_002351 [Aspergillus hancockii]|nr:hypothetical protein BBP40_002351 [Aspergillus hancockii]